MDKISFVIIPIIVIFIMVYGYIKKVNLYDSFIDGAKEGLSTTLSIFPYIIAMVFGVNIFLASGFLEWVLGFFVPLLNKIDLPVAIIPMAILRPISGTATLVILNDIFTSFGPDSFAGRLASTIQGCSDTTFYVLTLYFGSVKISKIRHTLKSGLVADLIGIIMSFVIVYLFFG